MPGIQSPTVRRRRLAQELRQLREDAGLTIDEVAQRLEGMSAAKISRIETARVSVRPRDVMDLLDQYGIEGTHRENLLTLTREARQQGWWYSYSDVLSEGTEMWVGLEAEAESIRTYEIQIVPGLLQTAEYAGAVLHAHYRAEPPLQIERRVEFQMARQQLLMEEKRIPIWVVLDEAALRREMGPPRLMRSQYRRLVQLADSNITIQVLPLSAGTYSGTPGSFTIMKLPHPDPEVVVIEYRGGNLYLEHGNDVTTHARLFDRIRADAKGPDESINYIARLAETLDAE